MSLMAMLVGIGVASFASLERKEPLQEHVDALAKMSRQALRDAVMKHQGIQIAFEREGFSLGGAGGHQHGRDLKVYIKRWMSKQWQKAEGQLWFFGEQGICEPLSVKFEQIDSQGEVISREVKFHPLTAALSS